MNYNYLLSKLELKQTVEGCKYYNALTTKEIAKLCNVTTKQAYDYLCTIPNLAYKVGYQIKKALL